MRFALEVVRAAWPQDRPLFFRVSAVDGKGGLWGLDDKVALAHELRARDIDLVDCSSGGISGESDMPLVPRVPGYQVPYASRVRRETGITTVAVGLITEPHQAEAVLQEGHADLVAMARELMIHADWPLRAAKELRGGHYDLMVPSVAHRRAVAMNRQWPTRRAARSDPRGCGPFRAISLAIVQGCCLIGPARSISIACLDRRRFALAEQLAATA